jgi:hypothetical protein
VQGREVKRMSCRHVDAGDAGAEVAEGSQDIRAEASECLERVHFVP